MKQLEYVPEYHHDVGGIPCDDPEAKAYELDDGRTVVVQWTVDEYGYENLADLGKYTSTRDEFVVDRELGVLLGEGDPEPEMDDFLPAQYKQDVTPFVHDYDIPDDVWTKAEEEWDEACDEWSDRDGYQEAAADLYKRGGTREYRYFKPGQDYLSHEWRFSDEEVLKHYADHRKEMGRYWIPQLAGVEDTPTRKQAEYCLSILYMVQDYERVETLNRGDWCMLTCWACLYVNEVQVDYATCGGMPSDAGEEEFKRLEREQIEEAKGL